MKKNYHKIMLEEIEGIDRSKKPSLLLHSCCAPCSSYVLEYLDDYFNIIVFFYNPNIYPEEEYIKRLKEQIRLVKDMKLDYKVIGPEYVAQDFFQAVEGYEHLGERSVRCSSCIGLRLEETARYAYNNKFEYFTTTLTISPMKDAQMINRQGNELGKKHHVNFLPSDFKKNNGFKRSIELSKEYKLYRQNYCGCVFSKNEYLERISSEN